MAPSLPKTLHGEAQYLAEKQTLHPKPDSLLILEIVSDILDHITYCGAVAQMDRAATF